MVELRIEDLLVGKRYRSYNRNFIGEIVSAEIRDEYENTYLIRIREDGFPNYHYATVKVEVA
jgi:hypothetical protein